jgi:hypothetical protein
VSSISTWCCFVVRAWRLNTRGSTCISLPL